MDRDNLLFRRSQPSCERRKTNPALRARVLLCDFRRGGATINVFKKVLVARPAEVTPPNLVREFHSYARSFAGTSSLARKHGLDGLFSQPSLNRPRHAPDTSRVPTILTMERGIASMDCRAVACFFFFFPSHPAETTRECLNTYYYCLFSRSH